MGLLCTSTTTNLYSNLTPFIMATSKISGTKSGTVTASASGWTVEYAVSGNVVSVWCNSGNAVAFPAWNNYVIATLPEHLRPRGVVFGQMADGGYSYQSRNNRLQIAPSGMMYIGVQEGYTSPATIWGYCCYVIG